MADEDKEKAAKVAAAKKKVSCSSLWRESWLLELWLAMMCGA